MTWWPAELRRMEREITGPLDEPDDETNNDPDSLLGDDDESGFDEMADFPDEDVGDDGYDDAESDDEDTEIEDDEE